MSVQHQVIAYLTRTYIMMYGYVLRDTTIFYFVGISLSSVSNTIDSQYVFHL